MSRGLRYRMSDDGVRISWSMWRQLRFPHPQHHYAAAGRSEAAAMDECIITEVLGCESTSYVAEPTSLFSCNIAPDPSSHLHPFHLASASHDDAIASDVELLSHNAAPSSIIPDIPPRKPFPPPLSPSSSSLRSFKSNGRFVITLVHASPPDAPAPLPNPPFSTLIRRDHLFLLRSFFQFLFAAVSSPPPPSPLTRFSIAQSPATATIAPPFCILVDKLVCHHPYLALKGKTIDLTSRLASSDLRFNGAITITKLALVN